MVYNFAENCIYKYSIGNKYVRNMHCTCILIIQCITFRPTNIELFSFFYMILLPICVIVEMKIFYTNNIVRAFIFIIYISMDGWMRVNIL